MIRYWYSNCPQCKQGRLFVMKRSDEKGLFLLCEECESAWKSPEDIVDLGKNFSIQALPHFNFASAMEITRNGWSQYALKEAKA